MFTFNKLSIYQLQSLNGSLNSASQVA